MKPLISIFTSLRPLAVLIMSACFCLTLGSTAAGQDPTVEELREQLQAAGMSSADIDEVLKSMEEISGNIGLLEQESEPALDAPSEHDPKVIACRKRYSNIITKTALDNFGDRLGTNALRIGQTCSAAAAGGTLEYGRPAQTYWSEGGWYHNRSQLFEIGNYWQRVINFNIHLANPEDLNLDHNDFEPGSPRYNEIIASFPRDLRVLITEEGVSNETFRQRSLPIHERCEAIRAEVAGRFQTQVSDGAVCLIPPAPEPAPKREEGQ